MIFGVFFFQLNLSEITICSNSLNIWSKTEEFTKKKEELAQPCFSIATPNPGMWQFVYHKKYNSWKLQITPKEAEEGDRRLLSFAFDHKCQLQPEAMELIDLKAFISYGYWLLTIIVIIIISPLTLVNCARSQERETL